MNEGHPHDAPTDAEISEVVGKGLKIVSDARVALRDQRTPPWKSPDGKARAKLVRARKRQRQARKRQR